MSKVINGTADNFEELTSKGFTFVDFFANWCSPCKLMFPVMDELAEKLEGKVSVVKVDADQNPELVQQQGVRGLPTMKLFKDGKCVETVVGARSFQDIMKVLDKYL